MYHKISRFPGITRSRIYDMLRNLIAKGYVFEVQSALDAPLPARKFARQFRREFDDNIETVQTESCRIYQQRSLNIAGP